jgi:REP-associated tyrosine transposase
MILSSQNEHSPFGGSFWEDKIIQYDTGKHCVFYHRYHIVWSSKYRYKVLPGGVRFWVRDIVRQVCGENGVDIIRGVLSCDHVHMCVSVPPKLVISDLLRKMKGRCSHKVQRELPHLKKRYRGCHFWGCGYFSTTNGAFTGDTYFSTWKTTSKILPTPAGSGSVGIISRASDMRHGSTTTPV